jgi:hypothetical protein
MQPETHGPGVAPVWEGVMEEMSGCAHCGYLASRRAA